jgi:NitT/TauT family transport system permease protein
VIDFKTDQTLAPGSPRTPGGAPAPAPADSQGAPVALVGPASRPSGLGKWCISSAKTLLPPFVVFAIVIGIWLFVSYVVLSPERRFLLPPPQEVVSVGFFQAANRDEIFSALWSTTRVAIVGLIWAIALGSLFAVTMSWGRWVERSLYPWAVVLQTLPLLAIVPVIGFWFQYNFKSRVIVCVLISLFPIITNTLFGLKSVDQAHRDLFKLHRVGRVKRLVKLEIPSALPAIFTGWRISAGLSVIGAIVGDFFFQQGTPGIGRLIQAYTSQLQTDQLFAAVIVCVLLGLATFWSFGVLAWVLVGTWHESGRPKD